MVGVNLLADLLRTIPSDSNLIFICDNAQLASISCGNVLQDMLNANIIPNVTLTKVFRYGLAVSPLYLLTLDKEILTILMNNTMTLYILKIKIIMNKFPY